MRRQWDRKKRKRTRESEKEMCTNRKLSSYMTCMCWSQWVRMRISEMRKKIYTYIYHPWWFGWYRLIIDFRGGESGKKKKEWYITECHKVHRKSILKQMQYRICGKFWDTQYLPSLMVGMVWVGLMARNSGFLNNQSRYSIRKQGQIVHR